MDAAANLTCRVCGDDVDIPDDSDASLDLITEFMAKHQTRQEHTPCVYCGNSQWVVDQNWHPDDPRSWRGVREPHDGLVPCGRCGDWDSPWPPEPADIMPLQLDMMERELRENVERVMS